MADIVGTGARDTLMGTAGGDVISGRAGWDRKVVLAAVTLSALSTGWITVG